MAELDNICGKISRVLFIIINLLLAVIGVAAIAVGSYVVHVGRTSGGLGLVIGAGAVLIVIGVIVVLVIAAGLFGAVALSRIMLGIYIACVVLIVILEIVGAVLGFVFREKIVTYAGNLYIQGIEDYRPTNSSQFNSQINTLIDVLQLTGKCCGWNNTVSNWNESVYFTTLHKYPPSCECELNQPKCTKSTITSQDIWNVTCKASATGLLQQNLGIIGGVGAAIAVIQLIPLLFAFIMICTISDDYKQV